MTEENKENTEKQQTTQAIAENSVEESPPIKTEENKVNWQRFREEKERDRKARLEAEKEAERRKQEVEALKAALEAVVSKPQLSNLNEYGQSEETDDQRVEKLVKAAIEKERERARQEDIKRETEQLPKRINQDFKDFNKVVTEENVDYLEYHHPEIANAFKYMPEGYDKWASLYKTVKKLIPNMDKQQDIKKIEHNLKKPQANVPNITDQAPQMQGWKMTEQRRMENWRRMQEDVKSFG